PALPNQAPGVSSPTPAPYTPPPPATPASVSPPNNSAPIMPDNTPATDLGHTTTPQTGAAHSPIDNLYAPGGMVKDVNPNAPLPASVPMYSSTPEAPAPTNQPILADHSM